MPKNKWLESPLSKQITTRQHILPAASIKRFCQQDGKVSVFLRQQRKTIRTVPSDKTFCAERVWDQRAESGPLLRIEHDFQRLASAIVAGEVRSISNPAHNLVVSEMYALWRFRFQYRHGAEDWKLKVGSPPQSGSEDPQMRERSQVEEESLELGHVLFIRPDGTFPARQAIGGQIQMGIDVFRRYARGRRWGILRAVEGEFIVPDTYGDYNVMPVSPNCVLALDNPDSYLSRTEVGFVNQYAIASYDQYLFASSFAKLTLPFQSDALFVRQGSQPRR